MYSVTDERLFPLRALFLHLTQVVWGKMPSSACCCLPIALHFTPEHKMSWKGWAVLLQELPQLSAGTFQHETCKGWKSKRGNAQKSENRALWGDIAKPRTTEMTDGLTVAFILGYFPINHPCQQPASTFCSFRCTLGSRILHWLLKATKKSLCFGARQHMSRNLLSCSMSWCLVGGKTTFSGVEKAEGPCHTVLWPRTGPTKKWWLCFASILTDSPCEVSLSPSLVLTGLWDWPQRNDGEYKMLQCLKSSRWYFHLPRVS